MSKKFDAVRFMRERREELSRKYLELGPEAFRAYLEEHTLWFLKGKAKKQTRRSEQPRVDT